jgi:predicted MFS family arabinose efflux permease
LHAAHLCNHRFACHNDGLPENCLKNLVASSPPAHPARLILILAITPAIGLGICRFAYSLVLPDMRDSLGWSYSTAGFMNTINAAGYLAGALIAATVIRRFGAFNTIQIGAAGCVLSLVMSTLTADFTFFSVARLISGVGAAFAFVGGGTLASNIAQAQPKRQAFYLSLFYVGPAIGLLISGLVAPFVLEWHGPGSWWLVWGILAAISTLMALALPLARVEEPATQAGATSAPIEIKPILTYLVGYFLFGAGYIAYMTFMIAFVRNAGGGALAQSAFWTCIGVGALAQPWVWGAVMARGSSGWVTALLTGLSGLGAAIPLLGTSPITLAVSALLFGNAFFAVVASTTAFVRLNYPPNAWPKGIALMTIVFGVGQTLGPFVTGAITDAMGSLTYALGVSAAALGLAAIASAFQRELTPKS